jgi:hypothetical protein
VPAARKDWRMSMSSNLAAINRTEISLPTLPLNANVLDTILERVFLTVCMPASVDHDGQCAEEA